METALAIRSQKWGWWGHAHCCIKSWAWPVGRCSRDTASSVFSSAGHSPQPDPAPRSSGSPTAAGPEGPGRSCNPPLTTPSAGGTTASLTTGRAERLAAVLSVSWSVSGTQGHHQGLHLPHPHHMWVTCQLPALPLRWHTGDAETRKCVCLCFQQSRDLSSLSALKRKKGSPSKFY